ncbi:MAG: SDR family oxidoreductase [Candidatus Hydrogenedentes bacterium]|nr:SDR family oxidoreductase [Candidatus Hydrogenedentota bacterium]
MGELSGRAAIVTGAGNPRGIGRAIAEALAEAGADVCVSDIGRGDPDPVMEALGYQFGADQGLDQAVMSVQEKGGRALAVTADVCQPEEVDALVQQAARHFGRLDILVNVAGGSWGSNRVAEYEPDQWLKTLQVNLFGAFLTTRACLPWFENQGSGAIVNIASVAAIRSHEYTSAYGASKAGLVQFTRDVAIEYGPQGIRANAILPGDIDTDLLKMEFRGMSALLGMSEDEVAEMSCSGTPLRRLGKPADVAQLAVFLCSDRASFLTGLAIPVTGGKELPFRGN